MRSKIRVKICGITNKQDMDAIIKYDAYYAGLMFFEKSPRFVETNSQDSSVYMLGIKLRKWL